jgi:hypothetical protein
MTGMMANPLFDSIRSDSRYHDLMRRIGVKQWRKLLVCAARGSICRGLRTQANSMRYNNETLPPM